MLLHTIGLVVCLCLLWRLLTRHTRIKESDYVIAPPELSQKLPIIGHIFRFYGDHSKALNKLAITAAECTRKGGVATVWFGPHCVYVITDPEDCLTASNECLDKEPSYYGIAKPLLGHSLVLADVPRWKKHRKLLNPAFSLHCLNGFLSVFNAQAKKLTEDLAEFVNREAIDHYPIIQLNTLKSICITTFGENIDNNDLFEQFLDGFNEIMYIFAERFSKIWLKSDFLYNMTLLKKRQDSALTKIMEFTRFILQKSKANQVMAHSRDHIDIDQEFKPIIYLLLNIYKEAGLSDEDIIYEANSIVGGGFDTSAVSLTMALTLLGAHPRIQEKAYEELLQVMEYSERDINKLDLPKLVYLEAVLKETMRLYPVAPIVARYVHKDVALKNYTMKADSTCFLLLGGVLKHPVWGPDADQFRPERWMEAAPKHTFATFSIGRRACIGQTYAMMSMKTMLAHLLRRFRFAADVTQLKFKMDALIRPVSGHFISVEERFTKRNE